MVFGGFYFFFEQRHAAKTEQVPTWRAEPPNLLMLAAIVGWTLLYFLVFERLGYLLSTAIYLLALFSYFHRGHRIANAVTSVAFSVVTYLFLGTLLGVGLPAGILS